MNSQNIFHYFFFISGPVYLCNAQKSFLDKALTKVEKPVPVLGNAERERERNKKGERLVKAHLAPEF